MAYWISLADALLFMIHDAWAHGSLPSPHKKHGLVHLLPKTDVCLDMQDWRPITLMPVSYKLLTKMITARLQTILHRGLHQGQYGFIPSRQILDNIYNAYVCIEYAKYTDQHILLMQVDIAKAFDCIQWDFVSATMLKLGFGEKLCNVIYCLNSD